MEFYGRVNFLKGGLVFSDYLTTVSRKYAEEIQRPSMDTGSTAWCGAAGLSD